MAKFIIDDIDDGVLEGYIMIGDNEIEVNLDSDNNKANKAEDFSELVKQIEDFANYFNNDKQNELKKAITKEILESGSKQNNSLNLQNDLQLIDIYAFNEGFVLTYKSDMEYPDCDIIAQLNIDYTIAEIVAYDSNEWDDENE